MQFTTNGIRKSSLSLLVNLRMIVVLWLLLQSVLDRPIISYVDANHRQKNDIAKVLTPYHSFSKSFPSKALLNTNGGARNVFVKKGVIKKPIMNPAWKDILEVPISVPTQEEFDSIPLSKRIAIMARVSVLHLTFCSCFGPLVLRGAIRSALPKTTQNTMILQPLTSLLFTIKVMSWHAAHNLLNDYQDLSDDDAMDDSFRSQYGCHALKQNFITQAKFIRVMISVAMPAILLTTYFYVTKQNVAAATPFGLAGLLLYTPIFKPLALGELLIYLIWGPLMAGFGQIAAGDGQLLLSSKTQTVGTTFLAFLANPVNAQFGLAALAVIMGKHTDKINRSDKLTLPKILGFPAALFVCGASVVGPHILLVWTFIRERLLEGSDDVIPTIPLGASLAFLTLLREVPGCFKILRQGQVRDSKQPTLPINTVMKGIVADFDAQRTWPLWFVAACGWHAITFVYLLILGSGLEWALRAIFS